MLAGTAETVPASKILLVGTKSGTPFAMKDREGHWEVVSIALWKMIADRLGLRYRFQEYDLKTLLENTKNKHLDVAIAAIAITGEGERRFDFSHNHYTIGLSISVLQKDSPGQQIHLHLKSLSCLLRVPVKPVGMQYLVGDPPK